MFGGDAQHTGRTDLRGPRSAPRVAWRVRTARRVFGSPVVTRAGLSVFGSLDGSVHAVDRDGVERWGSGGLGRVFSSPAVSDDLVIVGHDGGAFVAFGPRGERAWRYATAEDADAPPVVGPDGTVYVVAGSVAALAPDGRPRWSVALAGHAFGAPALTSDGVTVVVPELRGALAYLRANDGHLVRRVALPAAVRGGVLLLSDGTAVVGADDGHVRAFAVDGTLRWDVATQGATQRQGVRSTPALARDGTVVVGADDGAVYGLRAADGTTVFRVATGGPVRSSVRVDADGWMYLGSEDDRVWALDPRGAVAWSVTLGADVDSTPALPTDGLLVVGCDDGALYGLAGP